MDAGGAGGFFLFKMFVLALLLAVIPATIAAKKQLGFLPWYMLGVVLWIVATPRAILARPRRICPFCAEGVQTEATVCPHCHNSIGADFGSRPKRRALSLEGV